MVTNSNTANKMAGVFHYYEQLIFIKINLYMKLCDILDSLYQEICIDFTNLIKLSFFKNHFDIHIKSGTNK